MNVFKLVSTRVPAGICIYTTLRSLLPRRFHFARLYSASQSMTDPTLSQFLTSSKDLYLQDVRRGNGRDWMVVMGNEAGDLDSVASAIACAWIQTETRKTATIPLIQTKRSDLGLRPENIHALSLAGLQDDTPELLCIDDIPWTGVFPSNTFALVDHNRLLPQYEASNSNVQVVTIIDHHEDEGFYQHSAEPRTIAPAGSCSSHMTRLCPPQIPAGLASLLLSAILIDTQGLKVGGNALQVDHEAVAFLLTKTSLSSSSSPTELSPSGNNLTDLKFIQDLTTKLSEKKFAVSHLNTRDLLRRDYKQYNLNLPWVHPRTTIYAGLSTVPVGFKWWIPRDPSEFWSAIRQWMEENGLYVLGILTSYHEKKIGRSGKGRHKRQMLWVIREGAELFQTSERIKGESNNLIEEHARVDVDLLASRLWDGLQDSGILQLKKSDFEKFGTSEKDAGGALRVRIYKQGNTDATRKVTAPLMKSILEGPVDAAGKMRL